MVSERRHFAASAARDRLPLRGTERTVGLIIERIGMTAVAGEPHREERRFAGLDHDRRTGEISGPTADIPQIFSQDFGQEAPAPDRQI